MLRKRTLADEIERDRQARADAAAWRAYDNEPHLKATTERDPDPPTEGHNYAGPLDTEELERKALARFGPAAERERRYQHGVDRILAIARAVGRRTRR